MIFAVRRQESLAEQAKAVSTPREKLDRCVQSKRRSSQRMVGAEVFVNEAGVSSQ